MDLFETKQGKRIKRLEQFNLDLANENHAMREMLSNVVAAYCGHFADVSVGNAMRREMTKIDEFLNT
jgi:hypothetical protein